MRNIWFFGDSTTYGHGLRPGFEYYDNFSERITNRWAEIVSNYFNGNEINFATCGASNQDIQYRLITNLYKIKNDDVVIIQSTYPTRISVYNKYKTYTPVHVAFNDEFEDPGFSQEQIYSLKSYSKNFLIDNIDLIDKRDELFFAGIFNELTQRGIDVIFWQHEVMNQKIRKFFDWKTIQDETKNLINDYHLGWESQQKFSDFIINQYEMGNKFIYPNPRFHVDMTSVDFVNTEIINELKTLYKSVGVENLYKDYE